MTDAMDIHDFTAAFSEQGCYLIPQYLLSVWIYVAHETR